MRDATLVFLLRKNGKGRDICLAMKKLGLGKGRWNGAGGKVEEGESVESAAIRETIEEICVTPKSIVKVGELAFTFPNNPEWDQKVHVYLSTEWIGDPLETDEMAPKWFNALDIPYDAMWPDDRLWLPMVLDGKKVRASFTLGEADAILEQTLEAVETL